MKRGDVLRVAAELFARNGYRATNLGMVAERLGVTRQALYYHFGSKSELLESIFEERMTALRLAAASSEPEGPEPRLAAIMRGHLQIILAGPDLTAVLVHERAETDRITTLRAEERREAYTAQVATAYAEGVSQGALEPVDPSRAATIIVAAADSVIWWYRPHRSWVPARVVMEDTLRLLLCGFASEETDWSREGRS